MERPLKIGCAPGGVLLDKTSSVPAEIVTQKSPGLNCRTVQVRAEVFGWVCLRRLLWMNVGVFSLQDLSTDWFLQGAVLLRRPDRNRLIWSGAPMPAQVRALDGCVFHYSTL